MADDRTVRIGVPIDRVHVKKDPNWPNILEDDEYPLARLTVEFYDGGTTVYWMEASTNYAWLGTGVWSADTGYIVGDALIQSGTLYICTQNHTSESDYPPGNANAPWRAVGASAVYKDAGWIVETSYQVGSVLEYGEVLYYCIVAHTSKSWCVPGVWLDCDCWTGPNGENKQSATYAFDDKGQYYWCPCTWYYTLWSNTCLPDADAIEDEYSSENEYQFLRKPLGLVTDRDEDGRWDLEDKFNFRLRLTKEDDDEPTIDSSRDLEEDDTLVGKNPKFVDGETGVTPGSLAYNAITGRYHIQVDEVGTRSVCNYIEKVTDYENINYDWYEDPPGFTTSCFTEAVGGGDGSWQNPPTFDAAPTIQTGYDWIDPEGLMFIPFDTSDTANFKITEEPRYDADEVDAPIIKATINSKVKVYTMPRRVALYARNNQTRESSAGSISLTYYWGWNQEHDGAYTLSCNLLPTDAMFGDIFCLDGCQQDWRPGEQQPNFSTSPYPTDCHGTQVGFWYYNDNYYPPGCGRTDWTYEIYWDGSTCRRRTLNLSNVIIDEDNDCPREWTHEDLNHWRTYTWDEGIFYERKNYFGLWWDRLPNNFTLDDPGDAEGTPKLFEEQNNEWIEPTVIGDQSMADAQAAHVLLGLDETDIISGYNSLHLFYLGGNEHLSAWVCPKADNYRCMTPADPFWCKTTDHPQILSMANGKVFDLLGSSWIYSSPAELRECLTTSWDIWSPLWEKITRSDWYQSYGIGGSELEAGWDETCTDGFPYGFGISPTPEGCLCAMITVGAKTYYVWRKTDEQLTLREMDDIPSEVFTFEPRFRQWLWEARWDWRYALWEAPPIYGPEIFTGTTRKLTGAFPAVVHEVSDLCFGNWFDECFQGDLAKRIQFSTSPTGSLELDAEVIVVGSRERYFGNAERAARINTTHTAPASERNLY